MRFFLGIAPPEPLLSRIEAFRTKWRNPHHKVEPHITLRPPFDWNGTPSLLLQLARDGCRGVQPLTLSLGATGRFHHSRVLFLSVQSGPELAALERALSTALASIARPDPRSADLAFHPHLTLASGRFGIDVGGLDAMEQEAATVLADLSPFTVTRVRCYRWCPGDHRWTRFEDLNLG